MTTIRSSSDLQRNIGSIYEFCDNSREPVYITRNGAATLVVMNADAFEDLLDHQDELEHELQIYKELMQSEVDRLKGNVHSWEDIEAERMAMRPDVA